MLAEHYFTNDKPGHTTPLDLANGHLDEEVAPTFTRLFEKSRPDELTRCFEAATTVLPEECDKGWGGTGRVTLIGDAAHAIRPASGQGTAMTFEDIAVLCCKLKDADRLERRVDWERVIREFENERLKRLKIISDHEFNVAEASHKGETYTNPMGTEEYRNWVLSGV